MEENKITNARLSFSCNQDWSSMDEQPDGNKFCDSCQKMVYDLSDKNAAYFIRIMQENNNNVCGRFSTDQLTTPVQVHKTTWKKWVVAAMVFIGMGSLFSKVSAQDVSRLGKVKKDNPDCQKPNDQSFIMGDIAPMPDLVDNALYDYLIKHCKVPAATKGRMIVTFNLKKDGSIDQLAANDHLPKVVRNEVLRVIKTAPIARLVKKEDLKQSVIRHSLYFTFEKGKLLVNR